jgi:DNA-directed DNA polymerase III PolC
VSYSLGITQVDPIKEKLYFERFLNEARLDCPDIDLDIDWRHRDNVLKFVYDRYGHDHVAMMATYIRFQPRLAFRETAKAYGFASDEIARFARHLPRMGMNGITEGNSISGSSHDFKKFKTPLKAARAISGLPRHLGIHSGGVVITPEPISDYISLQRASKGLIVTQCDMYQAEKIGLVKIDILGQRGLAVIADCYREIRKIKESNFKIPENDPDTFDLLQKGKTIGVIHIESPGLRALLRDLCPANIGDITLALALIRPGASESGMKKVFLNRFHGEEDTVYPHHTLSEILEETYGVFIYQEQVILTAQKIAGFNLAASDQLRRAITKKRKKGARKQLRKRFLDGARRMGVDLRKAEEIYEQLGQFALFGFCRAHAATYGFLAYQSAYFKAHFPDTFMTAVLRNGGGYYSSSVYIAEARRLGIKVKPPDVNLSEHRDKLIHKRIYLGMERIRVIADKTIRQIENGRPFSDLASFLSTVKISDREMINLIKIGFFDSLETSRPTLLWQYRLWGNKTSPNKNDLFGGRIMPPGMKRMPRLNQFSRYDIFRAEWEILGSPASFHPLTLIGDYQEPRFDKISELPDGASLIISGWRSDIKKIKTRAGQFMVFMTLDSLENTFEIILFPDTYQRYGETIRAYRYLAVDGYLNREEGNTAIVAKKIDPAPANLKEVRFL